MTIGFSALLNFPIVLLLLVLHVILTQSFYRHFLSENANSLGVKFTAWLGLYVLTLMMSIAWFWLGEGNGAIEDIFLFKYDR